MSRSTILPLCLLSFALLSASRCYEPSSYEPTSPEVIGSLTLKSADGRTSLPADGVSRLGLVALISPGSDPSRRTITFTTSRGTFVGGTGDGTATSNVVADTSGTARIALQSSQRVESAVVTAAVAGVAGLTHSLEISFTTVDADALLRFVSAPSSAPADGATLSTFAVQVAPALTNQPVSFTATAGRFQPEGAATVERRADGSGRASVDLASPGTLTTAHVRATAGNVTREVAIDYVRALPNRITVSTQGKIQVRAGTTDTITVTATFLRDVGAVTEGTAATFRATDGTGQSLGFFREVTTIAGTPRTASASFVPGETTYRGLATIFVGAEGSGATGTVVVEIIAP